MMMKTILLISTTSESVLQAAKRAGLRVLLLDDSPITCGKELIDEYFCLDPYDIDAIPQIVTALSSHLPIDGVLTTDELAVPFTAKICETLGVVGNSFDSAYAARNKYVMRQRLAAYGVPCPQFGIAETEQAALTLAQEKIGFPLVMKPLFGTASHGVIRVNNTEELRRWFSTIKSINLLHRFFVKDDPYRDQVILEEYMEGREISIDAVMSQSILQFVGVLDKPNPLCGPSFEETILVTPSRETSAVQESARSMLRQAVQALGFWHGPVHAELRLTSSGPRILEVAGRPIGGLCGKVFTYCLGSDYYEIMVRNAVCEPVTPSAADPSPAGVMMLPVQKPGRLVKVIGVDEARLVPGVSEVVIRAQPGDIIHTFPEQDRYIGFILAAGLSPEDVECTLNRAASKLYFEVESVEAVG